MLRQRSPSLVLLLFTLSLLLSACNGLFAAAPAGVELPDCRIKGLTLPPGSTIKWHKMMDDAYAADADVTVGWPALLTHLDAVAAAKGMRRVNDRDFGGAQVVAYVTKRGGTLCYYTFSGGDSGGDLAISIKPR